MTDVFRRLLTPRWLGALALAILFAWACVELGQWQYGRHVYKSERNARLDAHYRADPVPATSVIDDSPLPMERQWTRVEAKGTYAASPQLYVRNRANDGVYGFEIVAALTLDDGQSVLVDRGWVANSGKGADVLPVVPPPPAEEVTVTGWAQVAEESRGRDLPQAQLASVSVADAERALGTPLLGGYIVLESERTATGANPPRPQPLERPDRSLGPHQAYAYQWWMTTPLGLILVFVGIRRELRAEDPTATRKPKKTRIWDEEDG